LNDWNVLTKVSALTVSDEVSRLKTFLPYVFLLFSYLKAIYSG
jgi:hypothetical protein